MPDLKVVHSDEDAPVSKVIATGLSIVIGIADDAQMTFQSGYEGDEDNSSIHARIDRMMMIAERQKARRILPKLKRELKQSEETLARLTEDRAAVEARHEREQADRKVQLVELNTIRQERRDEYAAEMNADILNLNTMRADAFNAGLEAYRKGGRQGTYIPRGQDKVQLDRIDAGIENAGKARDLELEKWDKAYDHKIAELEAEIHKAGEERAEHAKNLDVTFTRHEKSIADAKGEIEDYQALLEG